MPGTDQESKNTLPQILLTNDDGIESPGLWAAASALSEIGFVHVVAPAGQSSGMGRSMPNTSSGIIEPRGVTVSGKTWQVYAVGGSPAQAVQHGILEIMPQRPDLVVSGINYGENVGTGVTISGTVGAALEGAAWRLPSLAVSLQTGVEHHLSYSRAVDFQAAGYFTVYFARLLLEKKLPEDVDLLKVDVPWDATQDTPWQVTRLSRLPYYEPVKPQRDAWGVPGKVGYRLARDWRQAEPDSDVHAMRIRHWVSVTPVSLDMTSRVDLAELEARLRQEDNA